MYWFRSNTWPTGLDFTWTKTVEFKLQAKLLPMPKEAIWCWDAAVYQAILSCTCHRQKQSKNEGETAKVCRHSWEGKPRHPCVCWRDRNKARGSMACSSWLPSNQQNRQIRIYAKSGLMRIIQDTWDKEERHTEGKKGCRWRGRWSHRCQGQLRSAVLEDNVLWLTMAVNS